MGQEEMGLSMLVQRQGTRMWENDPVGLNNRIRQESGLGQVWACPQRDSVVSRRMLECW